MRIRSLGLVGFAFCGFLASATQSLAECRGDRVPYCNGCALDIHLTVQGPDICDIPHWIFGLVDISEVERARIGRVIVSSTQKAYVPKPGYRGPDSFVVR